jgi:hypothetical protein
MGCSRDQLAELMKSEMSFSDTKQFTKKMRTKAKKHLAARESEQSRLATLARPLN